MNQQHLEKLITRLQYVCNTPLIKYLQMHLGKVYLYGSSITDTYYNKRFNDLDLVVDIPDTAKLEDLIKSLNIEYVKNKYGGYRFKHNNIDYDVWNLKDTISMTLFSIEPSLNELLNCCMFSTQSVYYDTNLSLLYFNSIWDQTITTRVIDLVSQNTLFPEKTQMIANKLAKRYGMSLSKRLCRILRTHSIKHLTKRG